MSTEQSANQRTLHNRRKFFQNSLAGFCSFAEELLGKPQHRISSLRESDNDVLGEMKPKVRNNVIISVRENQVFAKVEGSDTDREIFTITPQVSAVFNMFSGCNSIYSIAEAFAERFSLEQQNFVRDFFINLAEDGICFPADSGNRQELFS